LDNGRNVPLTLHIAYISDCRHLDNGRSVPLTLHSAYISNCRHLDNGRNVPLTLHSAYISDCRHLDNGRKVPLTLHFAYFSNCRHLDNGKKLSVDALVVTHLSSNCLIAWTDMQRAGLIKVHYTKLVGPCLEPILVQADTAILAGLPVCPRSVIGLAKTDTLNC
jgi:hypothetical protein